MLSQKDCLSLIEKLLVAIVIYGAGNVVSFYNNQFSQYWPLAVLIGKVPSLKKEHIDQLYDQTLKLILHDKSALKSELLYQTDYIYLDNKSILRLYQFYIELETGDHAFVEMWEDVSKEYALLNEVKEEHNLLLSLINSIPEQVYIKDLNSKFILINPSLAARYGVKNSSDVIGKSDADFYSSENAQITANEEKDIIRTEKGVYNKLHHEFWSDGRDAWNLSTKLPLRNSKNEIIGIIGISHDITEYKINQDKYWKQANFDKLTGLSNRQHLTSEF